MDGRRIVQEYRQNKRKREDEKKVVVKPEKASKLKEDPIITMKEARFEVFKFGISGLGKSEKANAETERLISLGAKPAKNKCLQYQEYKEMRKQEKLAVAQDKKRSRLMGVMKSSARRVGGAVKSSKKT